MIKTNDTAAAEVAVMTEEYYVIPEDVTELAPGAFAGNKTIKHADLRNVSRVGAGAFRDCTCLETVIMRKASVIEEGAFEFCRSLSSIETGEVTEIGDRAFFHCGKLDLPELPRSLTKIGAAAFSYTALRHADLHWMEAVPEYLFAYCSFLTDADVSSAKLIGEHSFTGCRALASVKLGSAERIGSYAFDKCDSFITAGLPDCLREIGDEAFSNIREGLTVPPGVRRVGRNCFGAPDIKKSIRIYRPSLYAFRDYFRDERTDPEYEDAHFYLWESSIDIIVLDEETGEMAGFLPLYSDFDPGLRAALDSAFRPDGTFDYTILDTVIFSGMSWNRRCMDRQAVIRLKHPFGLSETAAAEYGAYLRRHFERMTRHAIRVRDIDMLEFFCDNGLISPENITRAVDASISLDAPECTAFLLERQSEMDMPPDALIEEL